MIPVIFACTTHSILQVYLERCSHGQFSGSFFSFVPQYFNGVYLAIGMPGNFAYHGMHLWYLLFLFLYGLICYRLFIWLKGNGRKALDRISEMIAAPGMIYIGFSIPLIVMKALLPGSVLSAGSGGWGFLYYIWFLISGYLIFSSEKLQAVIKKERRTSLVLGIVLSSLYLYLLFGASLETLPNWLTGWTYTLFSFFSAWCWLFAILGFGMRHLAFNRPPLQYANEGVLPFYIMHQTVLLLVGYFVMKWAMPDISKWAVVFVSSFIVITALYTLVVRRFDLFRFLFGMKTTHPFFRRFRKKWVLALLHVLYVGLIVFAVFNQISAGHSNRSPMPLTYDPARDIMLNSDSIADQSPSGVRVIDDSDASIGRAIAFLSGASERPEAKPKVYVDIGFSAPAGQYIVWLRGKSDMNNKYTDSVWFQFDDQIGTVKGNMMGNWLDVYPAGIYGWAGERHNPIRIQLKNGGTHRIRIQPRQTPHRIDQVWLSRLQTRIPDTIEPILHE